MAAAILFVAVSLPLAAETIAPLGNGYSAVPPENARILDNMMPMKPATAGLAAAPPGQSPTHGAPPRPEPGGGDERLSHRLERGADAVLSSRDGVTAAFAAALTATVSSNPASIFVGGLTGVWASDKRVSFGDAEPVELGERTSNLFRTLSGGLFAGGRRLVNGAKTLARKTGDKIDEVRQATAPMPLPGQERNGASQSEVAAAPIAPIRPEPAAGPSVASESGASMGTAPVQASQRGGPAVAARTKASGAQPARWVPAAPPEAAPPAPSVSRGNRTTESASPPVAAAGRGAPAVDFATLAPEDSPPQARRVAKRKLEAMPRAAQSRASNTPEWPERAALEQVGAAHGVEQRATSTYLPPLPPANAQSAQRSGPVDCDRAGGRLARGRLAWMECYYRMGMQ